MHCHAQQRGELFTLICIHLTHIEVPFRGLNVVLTYHKDMSTGFSQAQQMYTAN